jgi:hypothetical protein
MQPAPVNNRKNTGPPRPRTVSIGLVPRSIAPARHPRASGRGRVSMRRSRRVAGPVAASSSPHLRVSTCRAAQSSSFPRRVFAPGLCCPHSRPPREGRAERQKGAHFRLAALLRRGARPAGRARLPGAPPWRFSAARPRRVSPTVQPAPRCGFPRPGLSPSRSGPATSRACGSRRSRAGLPHPRSVSERLRRRPSMSEDIRNVAALRYEVNTVVACSQEFFYGGSLSCPGRSAARSDALQTRDRSIP